MAYGRKKAELIQALECAGKNASNGKSFSASQFFYSDYRPERRLSPRLRAGHAF
jgi:hypothetical protein